MLRLVRNQGLTTIEKPETSTYVPSFTFLFMTLAIMDNQLMNNFNFSRSQPHWHPFMSQAYFGVIIQIHVLRVMKGILPLPPMIQMFLDTFESIFPIDSILIPGPLVPILESITAFEGNFSNIGNVCPNFPTFTLNNAGSFCLPNGFHTIWPNVFFVLDQIRHEADTAIPANFAAHRYFTNIFTVPAAAANLAATGKLLDTPHGRHTPFVTEQRLEAHRAWISRIAFPTRAQLTAMIALPGDLTIEQSIGFTDATNAYMPWFAEFAPVMTVYARYFEGSSPLSAISTRGLGAAGNICRFTAGSRISPAPATFVAATVAPALIVVAHYLPSAVVNTTCQVRNNDPNMEELAEQYGMLSMVNVDLNGAGNGVNPPGNGQLRSGPYWTYPTLRSLSNVNIYPGVPLVIRDNYVKERV
jgi:hypothetical protein